MGGREAGQKIETPIEERSFRVPYQWFWPGVGASLVLVAGLITTFVFVTKGEFHEHQDSESQALTDHAEKERETTAKMQAEAAALRAHVEQFDKVTERVMDYLQAVNTNQATMLREVSVPERRIAKPRAEP